jgi:hypothetical protein
MMRFIPASSIKPQKQKWFMRIDGEPALPLKTCSVFAGIGGEGKSSFATYAASLLSQGLLEGDLHGQAHATIVFGPEDDWSSVHLPRFTAAGADLDKIYRVFAEVWTEYGVQEQELVFPLNIQMLEDAVLQTGAKLIIVDPISVSMQGDMNKVQDVRHAVGALDALAKKHDLAVILINHFKKGGSSVSEKMSGSHGLRDVVRAYLAFGTDEETGERIITQDKNNYGTGRGSWKFALQSTLVDTPDGPTEAPRVQLLGASDLTVNDLIDRENGEPDEDRKDWEAWLIEVLTEAGGSMAVKDLEAAANKVGFKFKTMQNGRSKIRNPRVVTGRNGFGKDSVPFWAIEEESAIHPEPSTIHPIHPVHPTAQETSGSMGSMGDKPGSMQCNTHGTNYAVSTCDTCLQLAKETA